MTDYESAEQLLQTVYLALDYESDSLLAPSLQPPDDAITWEDRGEWLMLAERVGAERVFFVGSDPIVVFCRLAASSEREIVEAYRRAWSLGRARCLFLALDGELRVYALSTPPPRGPADATPLTPLDIVSRSADVAETLAAYHREAVESGSLVESPAFSASGRADEQLLRDVQVATKALVEAGLTHTTAHGLIERVILVRYMEDRNILAANYFDEVARRLTPQRERKPSLQAIPVWGAESAFVQCLADRDLCYAVFATLAKDFNGDLFVVASNEYAEVRSEHLELVQRLLTGAGFTSQQPLFLWAYDFSIVPVSLISTMYEQFYRVDVDDISGTHYTPPELVEYVLSHVLDDQRLRDEPRVIDPACGSGIFLVEAYRRIVRHHMLRRSRLLSTSELKFILLQRIRGFDINAEAIRLAAFSLYLAYLSYQRPRDIRRAGPLPRLIGDADSPGILYIADAFSDVVETHTPRSLDPEDPGHRGATKDVVIGNPPWDEPRIGPASLAERWAVANDAPVGDRSPSQLFLWRTLAFIGSGGVGALLVSSTAFHNVRSRHFRRAWLGEVDLVSVVDFSSARRVFFASAVAPFMLIVFRRRTGHPRDLTSFQTVRPTRALSMSKSLAFASSDRRWVDQDALIQRDYLWKVYTWGNHRDAALLSRLELEASLRDVVGSDPPPGWGYQRGKAVPSNALKSLPSLRFFEPWGPIDEDWFEPAPEGVKRQPDERLYHGQRILIRRGIKTGFGPSVRLVSEPLTFRHTTYCVPLQHLPAWKAKTIVGILLSSLGRYTLFMRSASWGLWHDQVYADDILRIPIRLPETRDELCALIASAVDAMTLDAEGDLDLFGTPTGRPDRMLRRLDNLVFDLFKLSASERAIVDDFHAYLLGYAGGQAARHGSTLLTPPQQNFGTADDVDQIVSEPLQDYVRTFLEVWNTRLAPDGAFTWQLSTSTRRGAVAAIFDTYAGLPPARTTDDTNWDIALNRVEASLGGLQRSATEVESMIRAVTDTSILIIKRANPRLWSSSAAMEDAEATLVQALNLRP